MKNTLIRIELKEETPYGCFWIIYTKKRKWFSRWRLLTHFHTSRMGRTKHLKRFGSLKAVAEYLDYLANNGEIS